MTDDLTQAIDSLYKGQSIPSEIMKTIGTLLQREQEGRTPQQIGIELNLLPEDVRALAIRARGWLMSHQLEEERSRYDRG